MRKFISCLLALCTLWMSTWLVTDIHDVVDGNQPHPVFSSQAEPSDSDLMANFDRESSDCGVCSYDHGGHTGQALIIVRLASVRFDCRVTRQICDISSLPSHITTPTQRPPIV